MKLKGQGRVKSPVTQLVVKGYTHKDVKYVIKKTGWGNKNAALLECI